MVRHFMANDNTLYINYIVIFFLRGGLKIPYKLGYIKQIYTMKKQKAII